MPDNPTLDSRKLLNYLPTIYQADPFIGQFLLAFEKVLLGINDEVSVPSLGEAVKFQPKGLEEAIANIDIFFNPLDPSDPKREKPPQNRQETPEEFLSWLASWVALTLREDWEEEEKRRFISRIVPLYRLRGTKAGLEEMLRIYTGMGVEIYELIQPLQVGVTSRVGVDTALGGGPSHYFRVKMVFQEYNPSIRSRKEQIARAIIDQEKPAHTSYDLLIEVPTMQIGVHSKVGVDTLLGTPKQG